MKALQNTKLFSIYAVNRIAKRKERLVVEYTWDPPAFRENSPLVKNIEIIYQNIYMDEAEVYLTGWCCFCVEKLIKLTSKIKGYTPTLSWCASHAHILIPPRSF